MNRSQTANLNTVVPRAPAVRQPRQENRRMPRIALMCLTLGVALVGVQVPAQGQGGGEPVVRVPSGEVRQGDFYTAGELVDIAGRLNGDLVAAARRIRVDGRIDGDVFVAGENVDIQGIVGDSTRVAAESLTLRGAIDGDLLIGANRVRLFEGARVAGNVWAAGAVVEIDATVDGDVRAVAGEIVIGGTVRGNARLRADRVSLAPGARIDGDLTYRARTPLTPEEVARVAGTVRANTQVDDDVERGTVWSVIFWVWQTVAALLAGLLAVALFRGFLLVVASSIPKKATVGTLLGFATFLIVPILSVVAMVTLVGLPVGLSMALLFLVTLYVAKLPVAVWAGGRLLGLAGRPDASPYAAMPIGILLLYALFATPYIGWLIWLIATWLGLGALVLSGLGYLQTREGPPDTMPVG